MPNNKVLVIGSGGREHALALALSRSAEIDELYVAPGNAGTAEIAENVPISAGDIDSIFLFAREKEVDLTVVGPEVPLADGIADRFLDEDMHIFGPSEAAAQIEASKVFAKELMHDAGVPTAKSDVFNDYYKAADYISNLSAPMVVKADGLAAGKGVIIAEDDSEALIAANDILVEGKFGEAGSRIIVEEFLTGEETSILAFTDGKKVLTMLPSQDYKRIGDGDTGPNTGGMGAYAPAPVIKPEDIPVIEETVLLPTIQKLKERGMPYRGVLYAGLMVTDDGIKVLEFNCRFGDPETQAVLPLLEDDLFELCMQCARGKLETDKLSWRGGAAVSVVAASGGYPGSYKKGFAITGVETLDGRDDVMVYHAGTERDEEGVLRTDGGRVLAVTGLGDDIASARDTAYGAISKIHFKDMYYREDIAARALG
ncbi:MAG: phosphoribosylamine--glycine ligase [bacterium]|nr:phosphoribosylamine--glycine ligase [bacterium]